jgi:hypothetical protein
MNYPYPIPGVQTGSSRPTYVADGTRRFPALSRSVDEITDVTVDFTQLSPTVNVVGCWIKVKPGGEPQLVVGPPIVGMTTGTPTDIVTFDVQGGIAGRSYDVEINIRGDKGGVYSFHWTVNTLGDDCGCALVPAYPVGNGVVSGDGSIIVNTAPRFFVSATFPVAPNVLDRWYDTSTGNLYDYISDGLDTFWELWGGSGGGGGGGGSGANILSILPITPDGVTTIFTLATTTRPVTVTVANTLLVSVDGVWQEPVTQYQAANNQIQFTQAPFADSKVFMLWFAPPGSNF